MPLVGIDLGTTFSAIAYLDEHGKPVTVPDSEGELTTPSVVLFEPNGDVVVGREARRIALSEPARVAEDVKRYMGDANYPKLINGQKFTPPAISALILKKLKQDAAKRIGPIDGAVITVPAHFDEGRRQATAAAGQIAGLNVLDIINEPTSAALAYAYGALIHPKSRSTEKTSAPSVAQTVVVYDLGGGTFDVTVLRIDGRNLTVLATAGDVRLGGRDWDERLFNYMADQFLHESGQDPRDSPMSFQNLMLQAEETKKILSQRQQTRFVVNHAGKSFTGEITREQFALMTDDLLYRSESRLGRVVEDAKLDWTKIDQVLAVGGSSRMPQVGEMLKRVSGKEPNCTLSPDEAVAQGAAIFAAMCMVKVMDAPRPRSQSTATAAPATKDPVPGKRSTTDASQSTSPAPVAIRGNPLKQFASRVIELLRMIRTTNVNAHSLGVVASLHDGRERVSVLIPANSQLPVSVTRRYGTMSENQTTVTVRIVEGESKLPAECIPVAVCQIKLLPSGLPKASPIDVTFTYDGSGRLHVKAVEPGSGTWATTSIHRQFGLDHGKIHLSQELVAKTKVT